MGEYKDKGISLLYRLISAALFLPFFFWMVFSPKDWPFLCFVTAIVLVGLWEYFSLMEKRRVGNFRWVIYCSGALLPFLFYRQEWVLMMALVSVTFIVLMIGQVLRKESGAHSLQVIFASFFALFYIGWLPSHLVAIKEMEYGGVLVVFVFAVTWLGDTTAYFIGSNWGRHKLIPHVSPHKTVEGTIAGIIGSCFTAAIFYVLSRRFVFLILPEEKVYFYLAAGLLLGIVAIFGDLSESLIKRSLRVKDSGQIIPGHGGVLDRFDNIFFTAPLMYYLLVFFVG